MKEFQPFRLDVHNQCLWRAELRIPLTPKAFSLLEYLVERSGNLVSQSELIEKLWPDTFVQPEVLKTHIRDLRAALGDDARKPHFIETQHRRGYRFVAPVHDEAPPPSLPPQNPPLVVGQEEQLAILNGIFRDACVGRPQLVFITGEVGIGKTTLANSFERNVLEDDTRARVIRGQCSEGFGASEPYYPVLEAISSLLRLPGHETVVDALARHAPTWLAQFPAILDQQDQSLYRDIIGATSERMLRELCDAMEVIASGAPLVMIVEDVHWADPHTIDWFAALARGNRTAKLMVIATFRPVQLALSQSPLRTLKQRLLATKLCREVAVPPLTRSAMHRYLGCKSPSGKVPSEVAELVVGHSEGNPLFMKAVLDHLLAHGFLVEECGQWIAHLPAAKTLQIMPDTLRQFLEAHIDFELSETERIVLTAASACRVSFAAAYINTAAEMNQEDVEVICDRLSRHKHFVRAMRSIEFPDGSISSQFEFVHSIFREIFYRRATPAGRLRLHREIAQRIESLYAGRHEQVASTLAYHFEKCSAWAKVPRYLLMAAQTGARRFAYEDASRDLERALQLLQKAPEAEAEGLRGDILYHLASNYTLSDHLDAAIKALEAATAAAAHSGDNRRRVEILMQLAFTVCRMSGKRCVDAAGQALEISLADEDPCFRAQVRLDTCFWRVACGKWDSENANECAKAVAELGKYGDRVALSRGQMTYGIVQFLSSQYAEGLATLSAGFPALIDVGDSNYSRTLITETWLLLFSGNIGAALEKAHAHMNSAVRNGNQIRKYIWQLQVAWIHQQALDWLGAKELCTQAMLVLQAPENVTVQYQCLILLGTAEVNLGILEHAREHLAQAAVLLDNDGAYLHWYIRMQLHYAETELALRTGDLAAAQLRAEKLLRASLATAERTWQALAWDSCARVKQLAGDLGDARECIDKALAVVNEFDVPLARWHVYKTAMQVIPENAEHFRSLAAKTVTRLADSLIAYPALRETFLATPEIQAIFCRSREF